MNYVHSTQAHGDPDEAAAKLLSEKYFGGAGVCWKGDWETARKEVLHSWLISWECIPAGRCRCWHPLCLSPLFITSYSSPQSQCLASLLALDFRSHFWKTTAIAPSRPCPWGAFCYVKCVFVCVVCVCVLESHWDSAGLHSCQQTLPSLSSCANGCLGDGIWTWKEALPR